MGSRWKCDIPIGFVITILASEYIDIFGDRLVGESLSREAIDRISPSRRISKKASCTWKDSSACLSVPGNFVTLRSTDLMFYELVGLFHRGVPRGVSRYRLHHVAMIAL